MFKKILAVDDDSDILEVIKIILEDEGYTVSTLTDGNKVFEHINADQPDLILLDVMLGGMDGRDICRAIKSDSKLNQIPIIMISASHNMDSFLKMPGSPNDFLAKPFDINHLIKTVNAQFAA